MIELHFDSDTLHTFPPVFTGSDMSKFGLFLDCEALQFWNEATYLAPHTNWWEHWRGMYVLLKFGVVWCPISEKLRWVSSHP